MKDTYAANSNRKIGTSFEQELCDWLGDHGFWAHNMAQKAEGQPADVIAARYGKPYLIDCKVCSDDSFALSRLEPNQSRAMKRWCTTGNGVGWFAIKLNNGKIYMIDHVVLTTIRTLVSEIHEANMLTYGCTLEEWENEVCK